MSLLEIEDLHVRRGHADVLRGISFKVEEGQVVALLGSNGVGKSTILRTISGLHRPHRGSIAFAGQSLRRCSPREIVRSGISHVPEGRQVFPALTVRENLEMGAYVRGHPSPSELRAVLERFPALEQFLSQPAGSLSGGQQQMLAIARGLLSRPKLLLLDEPSLGLAPMVIRAIAEIIGDLRAEGTTVLLVEQNTVLALNVADEGHVLVEGELVVSGTGDSLQSDERVRKAYLGV